MPFMTGVGRRIKHMVDAHREQRLVKSFDAIQHPIRLVAADAHEEQAHVSVERVRVRHQAAIGGLWIETSTGSAPHPAKATHMGESFRMSQSDREGLTAAK